MNNRIIRISKVYKRDNVCVLSGKVCLLKHFNCQIGCWSLARVVIGIFGIQQAAIHDL